MPLTLARVDSWVAGPKNHAIYTVAFDSSYPAGGESLTAADLGLSAIEYVNPAPRSGYVFDYNYTSSLLLAYRSAGFTPAGTVAAPTFTGTALAAHRHVLHFETSAAANAVTAAANQLRTPAAAFDVAGVANSSGEGGIVDVTAGTPAGTNSAPAFTGTAVAAAALIEVADATNLSTLTGVRVYVIGE